MYRKFPLFLCACIHLTLATEFCTSQTPCKCVIDNGQIIDLSTVGLQNYPRFHDVSAAETSGLYSYNPCYSFKLFDEHTKVTEGNLACIDSAACVKYPGGNDGEEPEVHTIGLQYKATFGSNEEFKIHVNYSVPDAKQYVTVKLICDNSTSHHLEIIKPENENNTHIVMSLTSKCACPNGCNAEEPKTDPTGLSTGSKLLIAFFTIILAYFIVGLLWNLFNGAQGTALIPNVEFWNELPKLILEGVLFTCSCFGRKSSYGEV